jgi:hypothetical protein
MMTRRHLMLLGLTSAAASFAALTLGRASQATGSAKDASKGTIYVYAWEGGDGKTEIVQGIFALDTERMTWTKVAAPHLGRARRLCVAVFPPSGCFKQARHTWTR